MYCQIRFFATRLFASLFTCVIWFHCSVMLAQLADKEATDLLTQAARASQQKNHQQAIDLLDDLLQKDPQHATALYVRGRENFCVGNVKKSVADLDKYVELEPQSASRQWERGISYYYAGEYEKGAKQFELYQTYHNQDVENSAWRYLCVAAKDGVDAAKKNMLPIDEDRRVPMMQIYDLYRGKLQPDDVMKAVDAGNPTADEKNKRLFYAHLYLGLWYQAADNRELAKKHILLAEQHPIGHYMWDVAHVHADLLRAEDKTKNAEKEK
jgi:lipoprotein NlpI